MNSSGKSSRWPAATKPAAALAALLLAGCAANVVPVLRPVNTMYVRAGGVNETLVVLPDRSIASVYLHFVYISGRIAITRIGIVDHAPGKVDVLPSKTRVYIDDGEQLPLIDIRDFNSRKERLDFHTLKDLPPGAKGKWLIAKRRYVTQKSIRGPTVLLFYRIEDNVGFIKIRYRPIWDMPG
jgi:hypothetical protein